MDSLKVIDNYPTICRQIIAINTDMPTNYDRALSYSNIHFTASSRKQQRQHIMTKINSAHTQLNCCQSESPPTLYKYIRMKSLK